MLLSSHVSTPRWSPGRSCSAPLCPPHDGRPVAASEVLHRIVSFSTLSLISRTETYLPVSYFLLLTSSYAEPTPTPPLRGQAGHQAERHPHPQPPQSLPSPSLPPRQTQQRRRYVPLIVLYCIGHPQTRVTHCRDDPAHPQPAPTTQTLQLRYLPICLPIYLPIYLPRTSVCRSWSSRGPASPPPDPPPPPPLTTTTTPPSSSTLGPTRAGSTRWHATPTVPPTRRAPAARSPRSPPRPLSVRGICPGGTAPLLPRSPGSSPRLSTAISRPPA